MEKDLTIRYVSGQGKHKTRPLYEACFSEDSREFVDYYYKIKTRDNKILVLEEGGEIRSMLQLNPYCLNDGKLYSYIVAVATDSHCRRLGYMARLLQRTLEDAYEQQQAFLYLMPADEAIYTPFGFRFVYEKENYILNKDLINLDKLLDCEISDVIRPLNSMLTNCDKNIRQQLSEQLSAYSVSVLREADASDGSREQIKTLAMFSETLLAGQYRVYVRRQPEYYEKLLYELQAEQGGILLLWQGEYLVGYVIFSREEEQPSIQEVMLSSAAQKLCALFLPLEEKTPLIMARIANVEESARWLRTAKTCAPAKAVIQITDDMIGLNNGSFLLTAADGQVEIKRLSDEGSPDVRIDIGDYTQLLFGARPMPAALSFLSPAAPVFINDFV